MKNILSILFALIGFYSLAQNGVIKGKITNSINNETVPFANVALQNTTKGGTSDENGEYLIEGLEPGLYNLEISFIGFKPKTIFEIEVKNAKASIVNISLQEESITMDEVQITTSAFVKKEESPVSLRTIGAAEIQRSPGGNRDISKVIQSLPGVASSVAFRNDIIIRGGAPNENRFYLDGIEVPNINHFATQGSSGGPVGLINVNFIREVEFYSGAFPSNRGNALSSVFDFTQIDGNPDKFESTFTLGSSDLGVTIDGPISKKTTIIASFRRSYLQFLFAALQLPFLPIYNDAQIKTKIKFNAKNELTLVGLGALDDFELNMSANDGVTDPAILERNFYTLGNIPENSQWNYTMGANYKHFSKNSFQTLIVSRNHLNNKAIKYLNNQSSIKENLLLDYESQEMESKARFEHTYREDGWKINLGAGFENAIYTNSTFQKVFIGGLSKTINFNSEINFNKYALFGQLSKTLMQERMIVSLGMRTDFNDYSENMNNPYDMLSPRFSFSYTIVPKLNFNFNTGRYYQLPAYTVLGYRDNLGQLVNRDNNITYIQADHVVAGLEYDAGSNAKITVEGFYKLYDNYPFLLEDSISLANLGADFGVIGSAPATPTSKGRSYGVEFLAQRKLAKGIYGIAAYTLVRSQFQDKNEVYKASAWDNQHIISITAGKKFKRNWEIGAKWRFSGGTPFTPYDVEKSSLIASWDTKGTGVLDYNQLNSKRNRNNHFLDMRIDKRFYFQKWSLNLYLDIQNLYNFKADQPNILNVRRDDNGKPIINPLQPDSYETYFIENETGNVLPSIGIVIEL